MIDFYDDFIPLAENIKKLNLKRIASEQDRQGYVYAHNRLISSLYDLFESEAPQTNVRNLITKIFRAQLEATPNPPRRPFWSIINNDDDYTIKMMPFAARQLKEAAASLRRFEGVFPSSSHEQTILNMVEKT